MQQPAAEEKTTPRRRRADMYQQQGNAANVTNTETAKPAVEDVSGTTQKMPPIRSTFQRNAEAGETKQVKPVAPVAPVASVAPAAEKPNAPFGQNRSANIPTPGVPRPDASRTSLPPMRQPQNVIRRPVKLDGMGEVKSAAERQEEARQRTNLNMEHAGASSRRNHLQNEFARPQEDVEEEAPRGKKSALAVVIAIVLVIGLLVVGLLLIPDSNTGFLGNLKRTITAPLTGRTQTQAVAPTASSFTASITSSTAPYQITFNLVTSNNVTDVRVVDENGNPFDTVTLMSQSNTDNTVVWIFTLTTADAYSGVIEAEMLSNEAWIPTGFRQTVSLGGNSPASISNLPTNFSTAANNPAQPDAHELTADSTTEPTVSPAMAENTQNLALTISTEAPTEAPTLMPTTVPTEIPTEMPTEAPTQAPVLVTLAPTEVPTVTPTMAPAPQKTEEIILPEEETTETPEPDPTEVPTEEPTPEPTATPRPVLTFSADASADPSLIADTVVYQDDSRTAVKEYTRDEKEIIDMPAGDDYTTRKIGVLTYRGTAFRQNAAVGTVEDATQLTQVWAVETGSLKGKSRTYYGFSWANQPVIEQWARRVRQDMPLLDGKNDKTALKEVIAASLDGKIYFLDLEDGSKTREPIELGYPMRSTPSLSTLAYPQMSVGQYARFLANKTGSIGQHFYDLLTNKENLTIDGLDGGSKKDRAYNDVGAFDGSALYDRNSDTYITAGTNGMLYTVHMNTVYETPTDESGNLKVSPTITMMKSRTKKQKDAYTAVEAPIAMYGSYVFYADVEGVLRCVDTTTMTTVWAVETGDAVKSAVALDFDDDGRLWLYTANTLLNRSKGDVTIRRYDATTGAEDWSLALNATKKKDYTAGAMASPVIGQYQLGDLVYYTLSYISASGSEKLLGSGAKAQEGVLVALNKQTGKVVWAKSLGGYCYSSPVAVYNENGKGWIIQATSDGVLMLLDGLTGETINTLQLNGTIEASPAVYQNMLVIGTTGKGTSFLYGVKID